MAAGTTHSLLGYLRRVAAPGDGSDAQLLERFTRTRDEAAFGELLRRHGPMVLGVCARLLRDRTDAEDAFQATFLVLVRRASSVSRPEQLASWLYGVACRTALRARTDAYRRRCHEQAVVRRSPPDDDADVEQRDLRALLDEELSRLPERYRLPLVLCHLEGQTHEEVARRLGCPRETVTTRLVRGRERLRRRLVQRGLTLSTGALAAVLSEQAGQAAVPSGLAQVTTQAALSFGAGRAALAGVVSARVLALSEGVLRTMLWTRLKISLLAIVGVGALVATGGVLARQATAEAPPVSAALVSPVAEAPAPEPREEADNDGPSVASTAPVVVRTVPQAGDTQVDAAATTELRVTFSKDMADKSWSWSQISKESFPKTTGKPSYDADKRTCVLPVKLEPGKAYVIWINPPKFQGFRDASGKAAAFYPLVFETKR